MIKSSNDRWAEVSVVNNLKYEFRYLGKDGDIPVLVAEDFFKFPDLVKEFLEGGLWWTNGCNDLHQCIRPGESLYIHPEIVEYFTLPMVRPLTSLLGLSAIGIRSTNGNCFGGDMRLKTIESAFPHTDTMSSEFDRTAMIAYNINITDSPNVKTGFWSMYGVKSRLDFSWNHENDEKNWKEQQSKSATPNCPWFQIDDYGPYKLEDIHTMCYNSFAAYPAHFFHNPYIKPEWFTETQRISLAGFLDLTEKDLDFEDKNLDDISYAWEFLHLNRVLNFHPKNTKLV
tara:strand:- start:151 stop:1005 length:855 start_codon:yes stop_codon:yes gene_type:complete